MGSAFWGPLCDRNPQVSLRATSKLPAFTPAAARLYAAVSLAETARAHSGNPAFRRPSINSFAFDCPPRAINADIVKAGLDLKHTRRCVVRRNVTSEMGEGGREAAVSCHPGSILTKGFLPCDDRLVKATKLNKGLPQCQ